MLDLVERDVLVPGGVSFLRLDGSVEASQRFGIVQVREPLPGMLRSSSASGHSRSL